MIGQSINKGQPTTLRVANSIIVIICLAFAIAASQSAAQNVQLTAEQRLILDQLPPAQREQALRQLELMQRQGRDGSQLSSLFEEFPELMPSLAEPEPELEPAA